MCRALLCAWRAPSAGRVGHGCGSCGTRLLRAGVERAAHCDPWSSPQGWRWAAVWLHQLRLTSRCPQGVPHPAGSWGLGLSVTRGPSPRDSLSAAMAEAASLLGVRFGHSRFPHPQPCTSTCPHQGASPRKWQARRHIPVQPPALRQPGRLHEGVGPLDWHLCGWSQSLWG